MERRRKATYLLTGKDEERVMSSISPVPDSALNPSDLSVFGLADDWVLLDLSDDLDRVTCAVTRSCGRRIYDCEMILSVKWNSFSRVKRCKSNKVLGSSQQFSK
jgi:hypothetical protein